MKAGQPAHAAALALDEALSHERGRALNPTVVVRFIGGPADGLVFEVLEGSLPEFIGMGYPVSPYVSQPPIGSVRVFRYVAVN